MSQQQAKISSSENQNEPLSPIRSLYDRMIKVEVGLDRKVTDVHRGLLCDQSTHFHKVLSNHASTEDRLEIIRMHDQAPHIFEIVTTWLYSEQITVNVKGRDEPCQDFTILVDLYLFGAKYGMPNLRNGVIDLIIRKFEIEKFCMLKDICRVYKQTAPESPLRKLIIATYVQRPMSNTSDFDKHRDIYLKCPEFLFDLTKALESQRRRPSGWHIHDPCQYHVHEKDEKKCPAALETERIAKAEADKSKRGQSNLSKAISPMKGDSKDSKAGITTMGASIGVLKPPTSVRDSKSALVAGNKGLKSGVIATKASNNGSKQDPSEDNDNNWSVPGGYPGEYKGHQPVLRPEKKGLTDPTKSVHFENEKGKQKGEEHGKEQQKEQQKEKKKEDQGCAVA